MDGGRIAVYIVYAHLPDLVPWLNFVQLKRDHVPHIHLRRSHEEAGVQPYIPTNRNV